MSKKPISAVILVRVSDKEQETVRQIRALKKVARLREWKVVEVCEEQISGAPETDHRKGLDRVKDLVEAGSVTKVMVDEVSRIGWRNSVAHEFLQFLDQHKASLYWHAQGIETRQANGKPNAKAAIMLALLEEMARAERETITERTKAGLNAARARGRFGGRPKGLSAQAKRKATSAAALYEKGTHNNAQICEKLKISKSTLFRYLHHEGVQFGMDKKRHKRK